MSKTINFLNKVALAILTIFILFNTATVVRAEEPADVTEPEKELVLYNADGDIDGDGVEDLWVGFRYENAYGETCLEISYNGKSLTSLQEEGYVVQRIGYHDTQSGSDRRGMWLTISEENIESTSNKDVIIFDTDRYNIYQFRITTIDETLISMSERVVLDPDIDFPVVIYANPYNYDRYNFDGKSIKITLKYNDTLKSVDTTEKSSMEMNILFSQGEIDTSTPYFCTNVHIEPYSETKIIDNTEYPINYSLVTFYCNFSHFLNFSLTTYTFNPNNIIGENYNVSPSAFDYDIRSNNDLSLDPQKKLIIKEHDNRLKVNDNINLNVDILSDEILKDNLIWVSSDENIATVDCNGIVTATGLGRAYIYATEENTNELYDYCIIDVVEDIPVSNISLDVSTLSLITGKEYKLVPNVEPENALDKSVSWTSSDETVATVDENGLVTAKGVGSATITVTSNYDSNISTSCTVIVSDPIYKVKSIKITGIPRNIKVGRKFKLTAIISPSYATNKKVKWKSSNTKYATVNAYGTVHIKAAGAGKKVKITATAKDGSGVKKTVILNIQKVTVRKLKLKASKSTIVAGKKVRITARITPSNATNKKVKWKSSNKKYATVNSAGIVTTKKAGKGKVVEITAISKDNRKIKATIKIRIK